MDQSKAVSLLHKLINTAHSRRFSKEVKEIWKGEFGQGQVSENIFAISSKARSELMRKLMRAQRYITAEQMHGYLDELCKAKEIKVKQADKRGLIRDFSIDDYLLARNFIYQVASKHRMFAASGQAQFECHELVCAMMDFLLMKDTVENGSGITELDVVIKALLKTKKPDFFRNGYLGDLFVCDRVEMATNKKRCKVIICQKEYLSTTMVHADEKVGEIGNNLQLYKVA